MNRSIKLKYDNGKYIMFMLKIVLYSILVINLLILSRMSVIADDKKLKLLFDTATIIGIFAMHWTIRYNFI